MLHGITFKTSEQQLYLQQSVGNPDLESPLRSRQNCNRWSQTSPKLVDRKLLRKSFEE